VCIIRESRERGYLKALLSLKIKTIREKDDLLNNTIRASVNEQIMVNRGCIIQSI
jgi:hypothetical protein